MAPQAEPDLAGFAEAQDRLREQFGELIIFLAPEEGSWPSGTTIDPETGQPYDPVVAAQSSGMASASGVCDVVTRPYGREDARWEALGAIEVDHVMLIGGVATASAASGATDFEVRGERYKISSTRFDGIGGIQRHLTFGRLR